MSGPAKVYWPIDSLLIIKTLLNIAGRIYYFKVIYFYFIPAGKKRNKKKRKKEITADPAEVF